MNSGEGSGLAQLWNCVCIEIFDCFERSSPFAMGTRRDWPKPSYLLKVANDCQMRCSSDTIKLCWLPFCLHLLLYWLQCLQLLIKFYILINSTCLWLVNSKLLRACNFTLKLYAYQHSCRRQWICTVNNNTTWLENSSIISDFHVFFVHRRLFIYPSTGMENNAELGRTHTNASTVTNDHYGTYDCRG